MWNQFLALLLILFSGATTAFAAPRVDVELATERGVQITAPHEWLQLLAGIGLENVQIRGAKPGDQPKATNTGSDDQPNYEVVGIITSRNELRLPGGTFTRGDRSRIKDYFDRLTADGAESLTAPRGMFGLTEKEIHAVFGDLGQPIDFETKGLPPRELLAKLQRAFASRLVYDADAERTLANATPIADNLQGVTAGTGIAIVLRANDLVLQPEKDRGEPVVYRVKTATSTAANETSDTPRSTAIVFSNRPGETDDPALKHWPVGWELKDTPGRTAPSLFAILNAEIDGYTLIETLDAIAPRIQVPMYLDHAALAAHETDPAKIQIHLPKTRSSYKRVIDRAVAQARLGAQLRIDEAGRPFLWITR